MSLEVVNLKRKKPNEQFCLFCDNSSYLVKNPRPSTLLHIKEAANRRKDSISEKFSKLYNPDSTKQEFSWHQDCLATYISEEKIRRREIALHKKEEEVSASTSKANVEELTPKSRSSSREPAALKKSLKCIFCKKVTRNKDKQLHLCSEISAAEKIFSTARRKEDHVFTELSTCQRPEDLFAIGVRYHKHCYLDYLRLPRSSKLPPGRPSNQIPKEILIDAFDKLIDEIKDRLPTHSFEVRFLAQRLAELTNIEGAVIENRVVKSLLIDKFGENILFSYPTDRSKSLLAFMGNIPLPEIIEHVRNINSKNTIIETAKALCEELLKTELIPSGYLRHENLIQRLLENGKLPQTWEIFLQALFNAKNQKLSVNYYKRALSVFFDIYFIVTEKQTPKHIALAESIHHLTRSKQLISILNKFGHCISYKKLQELDSELTISIACEDAEKNVIIPKNIVKNSSFFLHGAIDNNDFNEETLSGKDSTHVTATVIYQEKNPIENEINLVKLKPTTEQFEYDLKFLNFQEIHHFNASMEPLISDYVNSGCLLTSTNNYSQFDTLLWVLCRLQYDKTLNNFHRPLKNSIPGWTPFQ
ncbi:unnamed protein product [Danaus chrysippus]|uniref:(African queen) hypothetical protein n=1 Tax=Danaus chrysippus TaxID=151541 RepID=A0A8J2QS95_9NEOP|nr:unnamed protein product [Danaus chrysippus]